MEKRKEIILNPERREGLDLLNQVSPFSLRSSGPAVNRRESQQHEKLKSEAIIISQYPEQVLESKGTNQYPEQFGSELIAEGYDPASIDSGYIYPFSLLCIHSGKIQG